MRELAVPRSSFDAAVCLFDSIGYGLTNEAIHATLQGIYRHLRPGGLFVVEFWHASAMVSAFEPVRFREWESDFGRVVRISRTEIDVMASVASVEYRLLVLGSDGRFESSNERHENRFFLVQEMDHLLRSAGFEPLGYTAGFDADAPVVRGTWHVVALARAEAARRA
jgi:SAM-dependent methyltransferase